mgnify:CR=1 FL=1
MPQDHSFDVVSEFDRQELVNAVDQARREITTRYDFKHITVEMTSEDAPITPLTGTATQPQSHLDLLPSHAHPPATHRNSPAPPTAAPLVRSWELRCAISPDAALFAGCGLGTAAVCGGPSTQSGRELP